ncbi:hypothetical protein V1477_019484, partial [Vespula maculifrons]
MAKTTSVIINTSSFQKSVTFVVDIRLELNLLKSSVIRSKEVIDGEKTIKIRGITCNHIYTRDTIVVNIFDRLIPFHIVDLIFDLTFHIVDVILIEQDGILSSKYLKKSQRKLYIPTRLCCFQCKVVNLQVEEDYIPRLDILTRIYTIDVLIKNRQKRILVPTDSKPEISVFEPQQAITFMKSVSADS